MYHVLILKKNVHKPGHFQYIPFIMRGNHFLVHGHKKELPHIACIFHLLKYVVNFFSVSHFPFYITFHC